MGPSLSLNGPSDKPGTIQAHGLIPFRHEYAWLENVLLSGLDSTRERYGHPIQGIGAYRCPDKNDAVGSNQPLSWHQFGRAADLANHSSRPTTLTEWQAIRDAAIAAGAQSIIEGTPGASGAHVHVEWES